MKRLIKQIVLVTLIMTLFTYFAQADIITISGEVKWTDSIDSTHPSREVLVHLYAADPTGELLISDTHTGEDGKYSFSYDKDSFGDALDLFIRVHTDSPEYKTFTTGGFMGGDIHEFDSAVIPGVTTSKIFDVITPNDTDTGKAFGVHDALFSAHRYATTVRGLPTLTPKGITVNFPNGEAGSYYTPSKKEIALAAKSVNAWDVIHHEYAHFLQDIDDLDDSPGGEHFLNTSNIPTRGKGPGTKVAWGEGLATYIGIASQFVAKDHVPAILTTKDTDFDSLNALDSSKSFSSSLDNNDEDHADGEGDEVAVSRILWDLADSGAEDYGEGQADLIELGHKTLYEILNTKITDLETLDDMWDYFFDNPADLGVAGSADKARAALGAVFQEYSVSPIPFLIETAFNTTKDLPEFKWFRNNDGAHDKFQIIVFNEDFTKKLLTHDVVGDVTSYKLTFVQLADLIDSGVTDFRLIISGTDSAAPETGAYWSGPQAFTFVIPEPTSLILLLSAFPLLRRRKQH